MPVLAMFAQGATAETSQVTLEFDPQGLLTGYTATEGQTTQGFGFNSGAKQ